MGLPNVGKSTLFNAITKSGSCQLSVCDHSAHVGVEVPDARIDRLAEPPEEDHITTFGLPISRAVKGSKGEDWAMVRPAFVSDAICHVVRCFEDPDITHVEGSVDPIRDIEIINLELIMADLQTVENRLAKVERKAQTNKDKDAMAEVAVLKKIKDALEAEKPARSVELDKDELAIVKALLLISNRSMCWRAMKTSGSELNHVSESQGVAAAENSHIVLVCAKIEEELSGLDKEERNLKELGRAAGSIIRLRTASNLRPDGWRKWCRGPSDKA
ncbi:MAG: GTPase [Merdibacter sp.]